MTTQDIYQRFQIPVNLQQHMLRVGALATIVCEHWIGEPIDVAALVQACLLHDIAKPLNFDLLQQTKFGLSSTDVDQLAKLQKFIRSKYSDDEHQACVKICQDVGCSPTAVEIVYNLDWSQIPQLMVDKKLLSLIVIYCDMRISPQGLMTLDNRINELQTRTSDLEAINAYRKSGQQLEAWLQPNINIDLNNIPSVEIDNKTEALKSLIFHLIITT